MGNYRATLTYALVFKKGNLPELAQNFVDFVSSHEAKALIEEHGLLPASRNNDEIKKQPGHTYYYPAGGHSQWHFICRLLHQHSQFAPRPRGSGTGRADSVYFTINSLIKEDINYLSRLSKLVGKNH